MIDDLIHQQHAFALYRLPGQLEPKLVLSRIEQIHLLQSIDELAEQKGFVMIPFSPEHMPIVVLQSEQVITGWQAIEQSVMAVTETQAKINTHTMATLSSQDTLLSDYQQMFQQFMQPLIKQQCKKLVLSRTKQIALPTGFNYQALFEQACACYQHAFVYLCYTPQTGVWFGASPERFLSGEAQQWQTVALAGTQSVLAQSKPLKWDAKNRLEQQIVVDYIQHCIQGVTTDLTQSQPYTVQAGAIYHLKTDFHFSCNSAQQMIGLIKALHPTPAVCGLPKQQAYDFICEHEKHAREYYSGIVGWLDFELNTDLYVNLRCLSQSEDKLRLFAGGGLLPDSKMESEWQETEAKLQTMLSLIERKE